MEIKIVKDFIAKDELLRLAKKQHGDLIKVVVDVEKEIMAVGGKFHSEGETLLIDQGSKRENTWGG